MSKKREEEIKAHESEIVSLQAALAAEGSALLLHTDLLLCWLGLHDLSGTGKLPRRVLSTF